MMFNKIVLVILSFFVLGITAPGTVHSQEAEKEEGVAIRCRNLSLGRFHRR
jgi:hypothetical protein